MQKDVNKQLSFADIHVRLETIGDDWLLTVWGGEKPHIGCTVLAVPRESLKGNKAPGCTSSVINVTGHKDEKICRYLAEEICIRKQAATVCTGGFHVDNISKEQIAEVLFALPEMVTLLFSDSEKPADRGSAFRTS